MTKDKTGFVNSIGMFDIFKGMGMVLVVFGHTFTGSFSAVPDNPVWKVIELLLSPVGASLLPAFFIISGYGFRKRPVGKCIKQQMSLLLKPYLWVAAATAFFHLLVHYLAFRYWPASVRETLKVAGGFLLALPRSTEFFGFSLFGCGAVWYIVALFLGWILLDILMKTVDDRYIGMAVVLTVLTGWIAGRGRVLPFCISQGLIAVGFLYAGCRIKKNRILLDERKWHEYLLILLACVVTMLLTVWTGKIDNMDEGIWVAGPLSILIDTITGTGIVMLILKLNQYENPLLNLLQKIGRDSLLIFCIHTVEMTAVPWYLLQQKYSENLIFCNLFIFCLRWGMIMASICGIKSVTRFVRGRKSGSERT